MSAGRRADAPILEGIDLDISANGITVIVGRSGSGKSTMLRLLNRLDDPLTGEIEWRGVPISTIEPAHLRRRVAMIFQRPALFAGTVLDNLAVADPTIDERAAHEIMVRVGLDPALLDRIAIDLSGGEAQRMCLARALVAGPDVLLADEPTSALDIDARRAIEDLALELTADGTPVVWVSHDAEQLRRLADHVIVLSRGRVAAAGTLDDVSEHGDVDVRRMIGWD